MPVLKIEWAVSERTTTFHTFSAADTQIFIHGILKIWIFNERPFYRTRRAELAFRSGISCLGSRLQIPAAQITITAYRKGMNTFYGWMGQNTVCRAFFTLDADIGIQLPDHLFWGRPAEQEPGNSTYSETSKGLQTCPDETPSVHWFYFWFYQFIICHYRLFFS